MKGILISILFFVFSMALCAQDTNTRGLQIKLEKAPADTTKVRLYIELSQTYLISHPTKSEELAKQALDLAKSLHDQRWTAHSYYQCGIILNQKKERQKAVAYLDSAIVLFKKLNAPFDLATCYFDKGIALRKLKKYEDAIEHYKKALDLLEDKNNSAFLADIYYSLGIAYRRVNLLSQALECYYKSEAIFKNLNNQGGRSKVLNSIGLLYNKSKDYYKALDFFEQTLAIKKELNDRYGQSMALNNLGLAHDNLKEYDKSISYYEQALKIKIELGLEHKLATPYLNLGLSYLKINEIETSTDYLKRALEIASSTKSERIQAKAISYIGANYIVLKDYEKALGYLEEGLDISKKSGAIDITEWIIAMISNCYEEQGNLEKALDFYKQYAELNDSINAQKRYLEIAEIENKYKVEKQKEEIEAQKQKLKMHRVVNWALGIGTFLLLLLAFVIFNSRRKTRRANKELAFKNKEIEHRKQELQELNNSKDKLFSIIGHDLRNPIGLLDSVLDTIFNTDFEFEKEDIESLLKSIHGSTKSALGLLENLLYWANNQRGAIKVLPKQCNAYMISDTAIQLHDTISQSKDIKLINNIEDNTQVWCDPDMLSLIFRNLISNAIKYSFEGNKIILSSSLNEGKVTFMIRDFGIGISEEKLEYLFGHNTNKSTRGTANEAGSGIGLSLCAEFVRKNNGRIWVESIQQNTDSNTSGSTFSFSLPANP